jgi:hypothetical protein
MASVLHENIRITEGFRAGHWPDGQLSQDGTVRSV